MNSISNGKARVEGLVSGEDCISTIKIAQQLGCKIETKISHDGSSLESIVHGVGLDGFKQPKKILDAGNSGTTMRLISGLLASMDFYSVITGDDSLRNRPMRRITQPLAEMGAVIEGRNTGSLAPLSVRGGNLNGIEYDMPVASAQLKSSLLIAGIQARGETVIHQPAESRDHTERILEECEADIRREGNRIVLDGKKDIIKKYIK